MRKLNQMRIAKRARDVEMKKRTLAGRRLGGKRGGKRAAELMTPEQRKDRALAGNRARQESYTQAKQITNRIKA